MLNAPVIENIKKEKNREDFRAKNLSALQHTLGNRKSLLTRQ